jgi:hypothetical protein
MWGDNSLLDGGWFSEVLVLFSVFANLLKMKRRLLYL